MHWNPCINPVLNSFSSRPPSPFLIFISFSFPPLSFSLTRQFSSLSPPPPPSPPNNRVTYPTLSHLLLLPPPPPSPPNKATALPFLCFSNAFEHITTSDHLENATSSILVTSYHRIYGFQQIQIKVPKHIGEEDKRMTNPYENC